jgi:hypothetical protein
MSKDCLIRPFSKGDENKIVKLLDEVFGGWPHIDIDLSPIKFWRWKYLKNPVHRSFISVALDGNKLVACHHNGVLKLKIMNDIVYGTAGQDLAVHPDYRGIGLSIKTGNCTKELRTKDGIPFSFFFTRNPILINRYKTSKNLDNLRPRFPFDLVNLTWIRDIKLHLSHIPMENEMVIRLGVTSLSLWNKMTHSKVSSNNIEISEIVSFNLEVDKLLESIMGNFNFMMVRSAEYLNWKYAYPGLGDFRKFVARDKGIIVGYMVLRINLYNPEYPVGYIVDLVTKEGRDDIISELIDRALLYFEEEDVNIVNFLTVKNRPDIKILKSYGFIDSRIMINIYTSQIRPPSLEKFAETKVPPETILARWGDHDVLPVGLSHYE